jgi:glycerol kinase
VERVWRRGVLAVENLVQDGRLSRRRSRTIAGVTVAPRSLVAAIDQGTTSSRCILFDHAGRPVASDQTEHRQIMPRPGWIEHDAADILDRVRACVRGALGEAGADARSLAAVGISNQRETTVVWSRRTGRPIANAIVWQDTRTADACARLATAGGIDRYRAKTGLPIST